MLSFLLARVGLSTLKSQIIAGASLALFVIVMVMAVKSINDWKQNIIDNTNNQTSIASKEEKIKNLKLGNKVDDTVINADDDELCDLLGGCLSDGSGEDGDVQRK